MAAKVKSGLVLDSSLLLFRACLNSGQSYSITAIILYRIQSVLMNIFYKGSISFILLSLTLSFSVSAQYALDEYYTQGELKYEDHIYKPGIRTVRLHPPGRPMDMPVVALRKGQSLVLSFDDLFADYMNMSYTLIHCNADWTPSNLLKQEYIPRIQEGYITQYAYSINALIPYTNYKLTLPNEDMTITKSGNYLLLVYVSGDEKDLVLSKRFMVYEDKVSVGGVVKRASRVDLMNEYQEVDFFISHPNYQFQDPFVDLKVKLLQNQRWDNAIVDLKPQFMQNTQLLYQYDLENTFKGNSEFRFFDLKTTQSLGLNVRHITRDSVYTAFIKKDKSRAISKYTYYDDINGQFIVRRLDATDSDTESDYVYVDFFLEYERPITEGDVYVFGSISDWKLLPEYRMTYNYERKAYQTKILLKQGTFNYAYGIYDGNSVGADLSVVDGSHWETENTYQIFVYNRQVGERYDRLIGFGELSSADLF